MTQGLHAQLIEWLREQSIKHDTFTRWAEGQVVKPNDFDRVIAKVKELWGSPE